MSGFNHPAGCRCPICIAADLWPDDESPAAPAPAAKAPQQVNSQLPQPWTDAIAFAIGLGMRKDAANRKGAILAATKPRATQEEALRLIMGSE